MSIEEHNRNQAPPAGYANCTSDPDSWWKPIEGKPLHGILRGIHRRTDDDQVFYTLELLERCSSSTRGEGGQRLGVLLEAGQLVGVGERAGLRQLREWVGSGEARVWILPTALVQISGGRSFWRFRVAVKGVRSPTAPPAAREDVSGEPAF